MFQSSRHKSIWIISIAALVILVLVAFPYYLNEDMDQSQTSEYLPYFAHIHLSETTDVDLGAFDDWPGASEAVEVYVVELPTELVDDPNSALAVAPETLRIRPVDGDSAFMLESLSDSSAEPVILDVSSDGGLRENTPENGFTIELINNDVYSLRVYDEFFNENKGRSYLLIFEDSLSDQPLGALTVRVADQRTYELEEEVSFPLLSAVMAKGSPTPTPTPEPPKECTEDPSVCADDEACCQKCDEEEYACYKKATGPNGKVYPWCGMEAGVGCVLVYFWLDNRDAPLPPPKCISCCSQADCIKKFKKEAQNKPPGSGFYPVCEKSISGKQWMNICTHNCEGESLIATGVFAVEADPPGCTAQGRTEKDLQRYKNLCVELLKDEIEKLVDKGCSEGCKLTPFHSGVEFVSGSNPCKMACFVKGFCEPA